ncbi:MAG: MarR family winged helix-turn-helix transcriptional regulator [Tateyamaria sp.]
MKDTELALLLDRFMRHIHFGLQAKADSFDTARVGPGGGIVLLTLAEMGNPSMQDLTRRVARDKSQMTRMIRSLEAKGLVERKASPHDARVSLVCLTAEGENVVAVFKNAVAETINEVLSPISEDESRTMRTILKRALG